MEQSLSPLTYHINYQTKTNDLLTHWKSIRGPHKSNMFKLFSKL
jgi:hypothetical protein